MRYENKVIAYSLLFIMLFTLVLASLVTITTSCETREGFDRMYKPKAWVDTIQAGGKSHEILTIKTYYNEGGTFRTTMHSPDCWCGKGEAAE